MVNQTKSNPQKLRNVDPLCGFGKFTWTMLVFFHFHNLLSQIYTYIEIDMKLIKYYKLDIIYILFDKYYNI